MQGCSFFLISIQEVSLLRLYGGVPEWLKGAGCKPVGLRLQRFESSPLHFFGFMAKLLAGYFVAEDFCAAHVLQHIPLLEISGALSPTQNLGHKTEKRDSDNMPLIFKGRTGKGSK